LREEGQQWGEDTDAESNHGTADMESRWIAGRDSCQSIPHPHTPQPELHTAAVRQRRGLWPGEPVRYGQSMSGTLNLTILCEQDPDRDWIVATIPEVPGVLSHGKTREEAGICFWMLWPACSS